MNPDQQKNKGQLRRFVVVGFINTALDFGILFLLKLVGIDAIVANIISSTSAFVFSFFANKKFTFKATGTNTAREVPLFIIVTLIGLWGIQTLVIKLCLPFATEVLAGNEYYGLLAAKLIATICSMTWNYILYSKLVFKKH